MITKLVVKNFKLLDDFEVELTPFTVLIGANACGKTTVLQALDFVRSFATRDLSEFILDRHWEIDDIKCQFGDMKNKPVSFSVVHSLTGQGDITWDFSIDYVAGEWIFEEKIYNPEEQVPYIENDSKMGKSSFFKNIDIFAHLGKKAINPALYLIKAFYEHSSNYELLSPEVMRTSGSRGYVEDIGINGKQLATFIHKLTSPQKKKLNKFISEYLGYPIEIRTRVKGRAGWIDLLFMEKHAAGKIIIKPLHMSDGLLRIVAFGAISVMRNTEDEQTGLFREKQGGLVLLDEVENGINLYVLENLINVFKTIIDETNRQVVVTSHNPVLVNFLAPEEIVFMWRDADGKVRSKPLFSTDEMKDTLDSFNPGEVWLNYSRDELLALLNFSKREDAR